MNQVFTHPLVPASRALAWPPHPHNDAHLAGFAARLSGVPQSGNPHAGPRFDVHLRRAWTAGWFEARQGTAMR